MLEKIRLRFHGSVSGSIIVLCSFLCIGHSSVAFPASDPLVVSGAVIDADGRAFEGAEVLLHRQLDEYAEHRHLLLSHDEAEPVDRAVTDEGGFFELEAAEPGFYAATVRAPGFVSGTWRGLALFRSANLSPFCLVPSPDELPIAVEPRKDEPSPETLAGIRVRVGGADVFELVGQCTGLHRSGWRPADRWSTTDTEGRAPISRQIDESHWDLLLLVPGRMPGHAHIRQGSSVRPGPTGAEAPEVRILLPGGRPAAGMVIAIHPDTPLAITDADGYAAVPAAQLERSKRLVAPDGRLWTAQLSEAEPLQLPPASSIEGRVVDAETGLGIADALVWNGDERARSFLGRRTDRDGRFVWPTLPGSAVRLKVDHADYRPSELALSSGLQASGEADATEPVVRLERDAGVDGRVVDAQGVGVAGARLAFYSGNYPWFRDWPKAEGTTDRNGRFRIGGLEVGRAYKVRADHSDYSVALGSAVPGESLELVLEEGARIRGRALDEDGQPLGGAWVSVAQQTHRDDASSRLAIDSGGSSAPPTTADAEGRFELDRVPPGVHLVWITGEGWVDRASEGIELAAGDFHDVGDLRVRREMIQRIRVVDSAGQPIPKVQVGAVPTSGPASSQWNLPRARSAPRTVRRTNRTDAEGRAVIHGHAMGTKLRVDLHSREYGSIHRTVTVSDALVEIALESRASISGRVVDENGEPAVSVRIEAMLEKRTAGGGEGDTSDSSFVDSEGGLNLGGLRGGTYLIRPVSGAIALDQGPTRLEVGEGEAITGLEWVVDRGLKLKGRVVDQAGEPLAGVGVRAEWEKRESEQRSDAGAWTDANGEFELENLPRRRLSLQAKHQSLGGSERVLPSPSESQSIEMVIGTGHGIRIRVLDTAGDVLEGVTAYYRIRDRESGMHTSSSSLTGPDGHLFFDGPPGSEVKLTLLHPDVGWREEDLRVGEDRGSEVVTLVLAAEGSRLEGRIRGLPLEQMSRVRVNASWSGSDRFFGKPQLPRQVAHRQVTPEPDGRFVLSALPGGPWRLSAMGPGARRALAEIEVSGDSGDVQPVELVFEGDTFVLEGKVRVNGLPMKRVYVGSWAVTDDDGYFRIEGLEKGTLRLPFRGPWGVYYEQVVLSETSTVDVDIRTHRVEGQVVGAAGEAIEGAEVRLGPKVGLGPRLPVASMGDGPQPATTDSEGRFVFPAALSGAYHVRARARDGRAPSSLDLDLVGDRRDLLLQIEAGLELLVRARLDDGSIPELLRGMRIDASGAVDPVEAEPVAGDAGLFRIRGLPAGASDLLLGADHDTVARTTVTVPGGEHSIVLIRLAALGIVLDETWAKEANGYIEARGPSGQAFSPKQIGHSTETWPFQGGRGHVAVPATGTWTIRLVLDDGRSFEKTIGPSEPVAGSGGGPRVVVFP